MYIIRQSHRLQVLYFGGAIVMILAVFLLQKYEDSGVREEINKLNLPVCLGQEYKYTPFVFSK